VKTNNELKSLVVIDKLVVGPIKLEKKRLTAPYHVHRNGNVESTEFIYSYEDEVFDETDESHVNLASMMAAQVALNYGLFCDEIVFDGLYDNTDQAALKDWAENTSREIFVKKISRT
jgi:hypothetical protein